MKFINKRPHLRKGHAITDRYLDTECKVDDGNGHHHYQNVDYDGSFSSSGSKDAMQNLTLENQENFCCYCMRDLHLQNQRVTLEHIIPQRCSDSEFNQYTGLNVNPLTTQQLTLTSKFTSVPDAVVPPRPHTVSFENMVASCDGTFPDKEGTSQCCNHKRGNKFVYPMFYKARVADDVVYMEDGTLQAKAGSAHADEYGKTIASVGLNCTNLKDIRRLWHLFSDVEEADLVANLNDKNQRFLSLMQVLFLDEDKMEQDNRIQKNYMKDDYWRTFLMYHWFHKKL